MPELKRFAPAIVLALGALLLLNSRRQVDAPLAAPLATVPVDLLGHRGTDRQLGEEELRVAGVDSYLMRDYARDSAGFFSVYVGYYASQQRGRTIHSPKNCLPGGGWEMLSTARAGIESAGGAHTVNRILIGLDGARAVVYYWYQGRGRVEADEYRVKWDLLRDAAVTGRSEEALVRVIVPVSPDGDMERADALARAAAGRLVTEVARSLPPSPRA